MTAGEISWLIYFLASLLPPLFKYSGPYENYYYVKQQSKTKDISSFYNSKDSLNRFVYISFDTFQQYYILGRWSTCKTLRNILLGLILKYLYVKEICCHEVQGVMILYFTALICLIL